MRHTARNLMISIVFLNGLGGCGGGGGDGGPPPPPPVVQTETISFDLSDFSEIEVGASFEVAIQQGDSFAVEFTVDEDIVDLVAATREGQRLKVDRREDFTGDIRADTMEAVITLPTLTRIDLNGSAYAEVAGFTGSFLEVNLTGSASIEGTNMVIDFVSATLSGNSQLLFRDVAPVPAGHFELGGSSRVVVNLMSGGTLTGFAQSSSDLSYYGSDVGIDVSTSNTATVTRLGDTRN